jgi:spermidine synthase
LLTDYLPQAFYDFERHECLSAFAPTLHGLAWTYTRGISNALCIGLGGGLVPMELAREGTKVDVVEINPAMGPIARKYFDLDTNGMNLIVGDGRPFVKQCREKYDAIVLDAFLGDGTATHLFTKEAFAEMSRVLRPQGVLVINCFGGPSPGTEFSVASIHRTLAAVFRGVGAFSRPVAGDVSNVYFVASPSELNIQRQMDFEKVHPYCRQEVTDIFSMPVQFDPGHGIILTDDYNPIEFYDAANREKVRRGMVEFMRSVMVAQR